MVSSLPPAKRAYVDRNNPNPALRHRPIDLVEKLCIEAALELSRNNRASAADLLGLSRQSLYSKLHRFGIANLSDEDPKN